MQLELLNTIFSALTFLVIATTAIAAVVQLRHLRASNEISTLVTLLEDWKRADFQAWTHFVRFDLPDKLKDPAFMKGLEDQRPDRTAHPELHLCDYYEQLGAYFKHGLLDQQTFLDVGATTIPTLYRYVQPVIETMRVTRGPSLYENFEYLAVQGLLWNKRHPKGAYPKRLPRFKEIDTA